MRIAIASFEDETMTFLNDPTGIERFEPGVRRGQDVIDKNRGIPTYINGYLRVLEAAGAEIVPIVEASKFNTPGPFSSWITAECFEKYTGEIAAGLRAAGKLDGVLLALHGAMAVSGVPRPEAEIVRRVRSVVGSIPVMVTLDMHANEDHELTDASDGVFILKTYPHVDSEETGMTAARCMVETIEGRFRPAQACRKPGLIIASIYQSSEYFPMKALYDRCREWEKKPGVYCVSCAAGFAYSDVPDAGMSVIAVTDGYRSLAETICEDVSALAWSLREHFSTPLPNARDAVAQVMDLVKRGEKPVVICDGADRIGDSTHVLRELLEQGATDWCIPGINDPGAAHHLEADHKTGDMVTVKVGGWYGEYSGTPVEITGRIEFMGRPVYTLIGPMNRGAVRHDGLVIRINLGQNRHVVVAETTRGANDASGFTSVGIDPGTLDIIPLKSRVHHRAYWDSVARVNFPIDAPGYREIPNLFELHYENLPEDIYPVGRRWRKSRVAEGGLA
ncbi:MAG: M81 family metallopeptidase [Bacillota bacterium]|nr:M81 family metallopeptidase [Bacillota bacterium]